MEAPALRAATANLPKFELSESIPELSEINPSEINPSETPGRNSRSIIDGPSSTQASGAGSGGRRLPHNGDAAGNGHDFDEPLVQTQWRP